LANSANLIAVVPAARIQAGVLPEGTALPLISVSQISSTPYNQITRTSGMRTDRVQITVEAASYVQVRQILALVRAALPYTHATVNSIACDSIVPDTEGPDGFDSNLMSYFQSQDYMITWSE
jgi:hypothetical protein